MDSEEWQGYFDRYAETAENDAADYERYADRVAHDGYRDIPDENRDGEPLDDSQDFDPDMFVGWN